MIFESFLFSGSNIWTLATPEGGLRIRFRFAGMEPPGAGSAFYETNLPPVDGAELRPLKSIHGRVSPEEEALAWTARELLEWRKCHRFCGRCGAILERHADPAERAMVCPACGAHEYPRIDPSVIVLVTRGEEVLLEHNLAYGHDHATLVAGHIEPGESAEEAVVREIREETGIRVRDVRYVGSQPWPFPSSLMLGFRAEYESGELRPDGTEIDRCGWFRRDALPPLPPPPSIAADLLARWQRGEI